MATLDVIGRLNNEKFYIQIFLQLYPEFQVKICILLTLTLPESHTCYVTTASELPQNSVLRSTVLR